MLLFKNKVILLLLLMFLFVCVLFYPAAWMGWFILAGSFYFIDRVNLDTKTKSTLLFILSIHQLIALYYFFTYPEFVPGIDFTAFNLTAATIAEGNYFSFATDAALFSNLLALFYKLNSSQLFGQEIAVALFMTSCFVFIRIIRYYKLDQYLTPILLIYALLPATLLWTSIILREPFELTFLMLAFECLLYFKSSKLTMGIRLWYLCCSTLLILYMCLLHRGLFACLPAFFIITLLLPLKADIKDNTSLGSINIKTMFQYVFLILLPFFLLLGIVNYQSYVSSSAYQSQINNINTNAILSRPSSIIYSDNYMTLNMANDLAQKIPTLGIYKTLAKYRYGDADIMSPAQLASLLEANTNYDKGAFIPNNIIQFAYMSLLEYAHYAFMPALLVTGKWSLMNLVLSLIYVARFIFFCAAVSFCVSQYKRKVTSPIILLLLYLIVSYVFSLGTITYGTALRHNMMTDWILILMGTPLIYNFCSYLFKRRLPVKASFAG